jgi:hypothetical protein
VICLTNTLLPPSRFISIKDQAMSEKRVGWSRALALITMLSMMSWPASAAERLSAAPENTFSIVLIPDTQAYRGMGVKGNPDSTDPVTNPIFQAHTRWIAENIERQRIAFVSHVGDIVDIDEPRQWVVAKECMDLIHSRVPYGISVGNHDMSVDGDSSLFQQYFPAERYAAFDWYAGCYQGASSRGPAVSGNNANSAQTFSAGGRHFLFLHLECNAPDDVLAWAESTIANHPDRLVFITSHMGWGPRVQPRNNEEFISAEKGRMEWTKIHKERGNSPQQLWDKFYRKQPQLLAVFSGDQSRTQAYHAASTADDGHVVHELLQDYGSGWLRMYRIHSDTGHVEAITFLPGTEERCEGTKLVPERARHQFEFTFDLLRETPR